MKKVPDHNSTDSAEIEALITRLERGQLRQEILRCSACQERFTTPLPIGVKPEKYDETCYVSLALALSDSRSLSDYVLTFTGYRLPPSASSFLMEVEWSL